MKRRYFCFGKRGKNLLWSNLLFILLNLAVFSGLIYFAFSASNGSGVYEEVYAKEIGLVLDSARPGMVIKIDFSKGFEIAEKNKKSNSEGMVEIKDNEVIVNLGYRRGYAFIYFSDYDVEKRFEDEYQTLVLEISEKGVKDDE